MQYCLQRILNTSDEATRTGVARVASANETKSSTPRGHCARRNALVVLLHTLPVLT